MGRNMSSSSFTTASTVGAEFPSQAPRPSPSRSNRGRESWVSISALSPHLWIRKGGSERPQDCQGKASIDFGLRKPRVTDGRGLCYARVLRTGGASYEETDSDLRRDRRCAADVDPSSGQRSGQRP